MPADWYRPAAFGRPGVCPPQDCGRPRIARRPDRDTTAMVWRNCAAGLPGVDQPRRRPPCHPRTGINAALGQRGDRLSVLRHARRPLHEGRRGVGWSSRVRDDRPRHGGDRLAIALTPTLHFHTPAHRRSLAAPVRRERRDPELKRSLRALSGGEENVAAGSHWGRTHLHHV